MLQKEEKNAFKSLGTGNRIATVLFYVRHSFPYQLVVELIFLIDE